MSMTSNKPYLIRAFYDWIVENECTPYIIVDAYFTGVEVPQQYVNDGQIVLNLAPRAVAGLQLNNSEIRFNTRFGGMPSDIRLPVEAVLGIYARENGQGMMFSPVEPGGPTPPDTSSSGDGVAGGSAEKAASGKPGSKPNLRVVK